MIRILPAFLVLATVAALGQPIGKRVDIGGGSLHLVCMGRGPHTVVMESGAATAFYEWWLVQTALKGEIRTCSYDRAGFGWSDPTPSRSVAGYVEDLHELLRRSGEKPPFIANVSVPASGRPPRAPRRGERVAQLVGSAIRRGSAPGSRSFDDAGTAQDQRAADDHRGEVAKSARLV